ncbi:hypothetical protein [Oceanobacter mangrovi]|uniref:hypothetical protein n=1 Tax=Oceanobacter mangrovi TaxID=2862510 RepID=UPI001C8E12DD|nr:hypothetical protein [Oceanobacter mangrovi]
MDAWCIGRKFSWMLVLLLGITRPVEALELIFISPQPSESVDRLSQATAGLMGADSRVLVSEDPSAVGALPTSAIAVLVGPSALPLADTLPDTMARIAVLVSRADVQAAPRLDSAIYLEPPLARQLLLGRFLLGGDHPLGILAQSQQSLQQLCDCQQALDANDVHTAYVDEYSSLNRALVELLQQTDALVGVYDTELYSAANIKNILITAYRQSRPLIGPSSAYIRAGALATTYSDLQDVAQRLVDVIETGTKSAWPKADYNPHFKVRFNEQVARSLNMVLPDSKDIAERIRKRER